MMICLIVKAIFIIFFNFGFCSDFMFTKKFNLMFLISQVEGEKIEGIFMDFKF